MALDRVGGIDLTIVYCTLCGTVIPYKSVVGNRRLTFGTSGLLYRLNKLMFDEETHSLWSSLEGVPVVGSLVDRGLRLPFRSVVTTTWDEWSGIIRRQRCCRSRRGSNGTTPKVWRIATTSQRTV